MPSLTSSSATATATATTTDDLIGSYRLTNTYTTASNERINPFDKNNKIIEKTTVPYGQSPSSVISATITTAISSSIGTAPVPVAIPIDTPITEIVKDKKYTPSYSTEKDYSATSSAASAVLPDSSSSKRSDASKYSFGTNQYTRSLSDADIIFGAEELSNAVRTESFDKARPTPGLGSTSKNKYSRDGTNFNTSVDSSDSIFGTTDIKRDTYYTNRSMSVSSAKDVDYIYQQPSDSNTATTTATYRVYEGIQNAAFSDFDSPSRSSVSSTTSAPGGTNAAISSNTKKRSTYADDDDYDLK